jgi:protein pelota
LAQEILMRQYKRVIDRKTGAGIVKLEAHDVEDMWHVYNLVAVGDAITASTTRKVKSESSSGASESERMRITLSVRVTSISYDSLAAGLRVAGKTIVEHQHVAAGAFHTIEIAPFRAFTLEKEYWDSIYVERVESSLNPAIDADLAAVIMHEGLAHVLLVSRSLTLTRARIETSIPKKGKSAIYSRGSATTKFFDQVVRAIELHIDLATVKVLLIASPGFLKDEFFKHMMLDASRRDLRQVIENKSKIVLGHSSSGHKHALHEVLSRPELQSRLTNTKAVAEIKALTDFNDMLTTDENRAFYGPSHVFPAVENGAVQTLLITDELFRALEVVIRQRYVTLVEDVKSQGGEVFVFSTQHVSGAQLTAMSGLAAILRFPMPQLNDIEIVDGEESNSSDMSDKASSSDSDSHCDKTRDCWR